MPKYYQLDKVHVEAVVGLVGPDTLQVVIPGPSTENRIQIPMSCVVHHERGVLHAGEKVQFGQGKKTVTGTVRHVHDGSAWIETADGSNSVVALDTLSRV